MKDELLENDGFRNLLDWQFWSKMLLMAPRKEVEDEQW